MNRIAIFAHYSNKNKIDDYVLFYLKELRKQVSYIEFVSDSDLPKSEVLKIKELVNHSIVCKHGEYDFGSYKRGFLYLLQNGMLANVDELIFANDSCYAPLFPFNDMFEKMSYLNNDFWGNTSNCKTEYESLNHVQSYFVVFKSILGLFFFFKA